MSYSDYEQDSEVELEEEQDAAEVQAMKNMVAYCKYGNLNKVIEVLEKEGDGYARRTDLEGHTFVHWAALGGHNKLIDYLLEKGAPLNNHSKNDYGPLPIHWACVYGHIMTVEHFLEKGVPIDATDLNGCSPLIVSAQYGESLCVSYLLQKGANKFHVDNNGDSALHWASFKGHPEIVFIMLNAGLNASQKDSFGQTPLHSACIKGDIQCAEMLIEHGASSDEYDTNNKTPRMLAMGRRHRMLLKFLDKKDTGGESLWDWRTIVFGPPSRNRYALIFFICGMFIWAYPFYFFKVVPITLEDQYNTHLAFWIISIFQWFFFVRTKFLDSGFVKQNRQAYDDAVKMIGNPASWGDYRDFNNPVFNICHTCKTVRPVRSKHCRYCNRCVEEYDHHCMWLDKCVGRKNRVPFTIFLGILGVNSMFAIYFMWEIIRIQGADVFVYIGMILFTIFFISGTVQSVLLFQMVLSNMTTNEKANYHRYRHFKSVDGKFHNPFDRGILMNCMEYWHLVDPAHITKTKTKGHSHIV